MKTYKYDSEIVDLVHKILNSGNFHNETVNESLLLKLFDLRGTPLNVDKTQYCRDAEVDWVRENPLNILSETDRLLNVKR